MHIVQASCGCLRNKVRAIAEVDTLVPHIDTEPVRVNIGDGPSKLDHICPALCTALSKQALLTLTGMQQVEEVAFSPPQTQKSAV